MREELFKMERKGLVVEGQKVDVTERVNGSLYSYLVKPSVAMSGIYRSNQRKDAALHPESEPHIDDMTILVSRLI